MATATQVEPIPKTVAEKLEVHERNIKLFIRGTQKAAGEHFGYAYLTGREMLLAKAVIPHGNSHCNNAGLKDWAESKFKHAPYRTLTHWMEFARCIDEQNGKLAESPKLRLTLTKGKLTKLDRGLILDAVKNTMDGKGMLAFMRASHLLRDAQKPEHHERKPVDAEKAAAAKSKQAARLWQTITADLTLGESLIPNLDTDTRRAAATACLSAANKLIAALEPKLQKEFLGHFVDSSHAIRQRLSAKSH